GLFFCVPLYLSVALGLSAVDTGIRIMPLSLTLLLAAVGIPKLVPNASPRRVVRLGFLSLLAGIVSLMGALEVGVGPEVVTGPLLLAGLGIGALASQLGAVTVSAVPDEQSGEVGGIQNTFTNLGASIGTALAGAVLISALTTSFFTGIDDNEAIPPSVTAQAQVELASGVPFVSDAQLETALADAGVDDTEAAAIMEENTQSRIAGLKSALAVLAVLALVALFASGNLPTRQPGASTPDEAAEVSPPAAR
ncbi:MAG TPA: MFS transporter, partial [Ornithinibacter sp.]|nr:MFS transporter [Ornithinibacter sp.]